MSTATADPLKTRNASSISPFRRRILKFRSLRRGYYAFVVLATAYLVSFALPLLVNNKALAVRYNGEYYFPVLRFYQAGQFGVEGFGEPSYRDLQARFDQDGNGNRVWMPPYPYSPLESLLDLPGNPPHRPSWEHIMGTDDRARDVFARLAYGFNVSMTFALLVLAFSYLAGVSVGAALGYLSSYVDMIGQRFIEIWSSLPFLYTIIIVSSIIVPTYLPGQNLVLQPSFWLLIAILVAFNWMGITYYVRGEFYREKTRDYVGAALSLGVSDAAIMFKHILPNALTPVVSFMPFMIVANIEALVALDFLGFGLPAPTPSWGELIAQGMNNFVPTNIKWWLILYPLGALFLTLQLIVFIGESVREAFDPREFSRLR